ncbi:unnamed protein product [Rangifer tarandus platyrhynchus]|uniref:Uncharacterized protein n=1 Tax=Rangifer tarandus platyrhynchus TaxID=3082113 RepID=A0AC60A6H4_RANTA
MMSHGQLKHASCQIHMQGSIFSLTQFVLKTSRFYLKFFMFLQIAVKPFVHLLSFLAYLICQSFLYQMFYCSDFLPPATGESPQRLPFSEFGGGHSERGGLVVKNLPAKQETWVQSLGWEDPLEMQMAKHSSSLA